MTKQYDTYTRVCHRNALLYGSFKYQDDSVQFIYLIIQSMQGLMGNVITESWTLPPQCSTAVMSSLATLGCFQLLVCCCAVARVFWVVKCVAMQFWVIVHSFIGFSDIFSDNLFIWSIVYLFVYWLIDWFMCPFIHLIIVLFIHSCIYSFVPSFIHLCSFMCSFIHSFNHSFICSFIRSFNHSCIHLFNHSFILSFVSVHSLIYSCLHPIICFYSFTNSFIRPLMC